MLQKFSQKLTAHQEQSVALFYPDYLYSQNDTSLVFQFPCRHDGYLMETSRLLSQIRNIVNSLSTIITQKNFKQRVVSVPTNHQASRSDRLLRGRHQSWQHLCSYKKHRRARARRLRRCQGGFFSSAPAAATATATILLSGVV